MKSPKRPTLIAATALIAAAAPGRAEDITVYAGQTVSRTNAVFDGATVYGTLNLTGGSVNGVVKRGASSRVTFSGTTLNPAGNGYFQAMEGATLDLTALTFSNATVGNLAADGIGSVLKAKNLNVTGGYGGSYGGGYATSTVTATNGGVVELAGGSVTSITANNGGTVKLTGGSVKHVRIDGSSSSVTFSGTTLNAGGGGIFTTQGGATLDLTGQTFSGSPLGLLSTAETGSRITAANLVIEAAYSGYGATLELTGGSVRSLHVSGGGVIAFSGVTLNTGGGGIFTSEDSLLDLNNYTFAETSVGSLSARNAGGRLKATGLNANAASAEYGGVVELIGGSVNSLYLSRVNSAITLASTTLNAGGNGRFQAGDGASLDLTGRDFANRTIIELKTTYSGLGTGTYGASIKAANLNVTTWGVSGAEGSSMDLSDITTTTLSFAGIQLLGKNLTVSVNSSITGTLVKITDSTWTSATQSFYASNTYLADCVLTEAHFGQASRNTTSEVSNSTMTSAYTIGTLNLKGGSIGTANIGLAVVNGNAVRGVLNIGGALSDPGLGVTFGNTGAITDHGILAFNQTDAVTVGNAITGSGIVVQAGVGSTLLEGNSTYTGGTTVSGGLLRAGHARAFGTGNVTVNTGGTLDLNGFNVANVITLNGGTLFGAQNRTTALTASSGTTTITSNVGGGIVVNSGATIKLAPDVTVAGGIGVNVGGRVSGTGNTGNLYLSPGGTLAPGNSPGIMNASNVTWDGGAIYEWEINNSIGAAGTAFDRLLASGTLNVGATSVNKFVIKIIGLDGSNLSGAVQNWNPNTDAAWIIAQAEGGAANFDAAKFELQTGRFTDHNAVAGDFSLHLSGDGKSVTLNYTATPVPEPSAYGLLAAGALAATALPRRRSKAA